MPVALLLCEGTAEGADQRLLHNLLRGLSIKIDPVGGKPSIPNLVQGLRRQSVVGCCAICDSDFPRAPEEWSSAPDADAWYANVNSARQMIGWRWRRKEIENYLLDPTVLARALRWSETTRNWYQSCLDEIFDSIGPLTAARMALTACAPIKLRVDTGLHIPEGSEDPVVSIRKLLRKRAEEHSRGACMDGDALVERFDLLLPQCRPGGRLRGHALELFSGKDVKGRLFQRSRLSEANLKSWVFVVEEVLKAMRDDPRPHEWLPEWTSLRAAIAAWEPDSV